MTRSFSLIASMLLGLSLYVMAQDTDLDGLPDDWELSHFPNLSQAGAFTNVDGDPSTDFEEFVAGTDPDLATEFFRIRGFSVGSRLEARTAELPVSGPGYAGLSRSYDYEYRVTRARAARWRPVAATSMQETSNEWVLNWTPSGGPVWVRGVVRLKPPGPAPTPSASRLEDLDSSGSFVVYYGNDFSEADLQLLGSFDVVVLEPSAPDLNPAKIARLQQDGVSLVLGYISIGEDPGAAPLLIGDGSGPVSFSNSVIGASNPVDWLEAGCAHSPTDLFLFVRTDGTAPLGIGHNIFFDTDTNRGTGYRGGGDTFPLGAEFLLQGGSLFAYTGAATDWSWSFVAGAASASAAENFEWSIPFTSLGNPSTLDLFYFGDNPALGGDTLDVFPDTALQAGGGGKAFRYSR